MPAELAWTKETPTQPGLYVIRAAEWHPAAAVIWKMPSGEFLDDDGAEHSVEELIADKLEFLGPLPE